MVVVDASQYSKWQDIFVQHGIGEIRGLKDDLKRQSDNKRQELRGLIGERYHDVLDTADKIDHMNQIGIKQEEGLVEMCGGSRRKFKVWEGGADNVSKYNNLNTSRLQTAAVKELFDLSIVFLRNKLRSHQGDYICIARVFNLAELLLSRRRQNNNNSAELEQLQSQFSQLLHNELLETSIDSDNNNGYAAPVDLFMAYMIFNKKPPQDTLEEFLEFRRKHISSIVTNTATEKDSDHCYSIIVETLKLVSTTLYITEQAFGKNQVHRMAVQHSEVYTLLHSAEFEDLFELDIPKYEKWLPEEVLQARSIPPQCIRGIKNSGKYTSDTKEEFMQKQTKFGHSIIELFSERLPTIFSNISSMDFMVQLYRQVLELLKDNRVLRRLKGQDEEFFSATIRNRWVSRFDEIIKQDTLSLVNIESSLKAPPTTSFEDNSNSILSANSLNIGGSNHSSNDDLEVIDNIYSSLKRQSIGNVGSHFQPIGDQIESWHAKLCSMQKTLDEVQRLKNHVTISYNAANTEDDDDDTYDEQDEIWRSTEDKEIANNYQTFLKTINEHVREVYDKLVKVAGETLSNSATSQLNVTSAVFVIRALLCLEYFITKLKQGEAGLLKHFQSSTTSHSEILKGYEIISNLLPLEDEYALEDLQASIDQGLWHDVQHEEEEKESDITVNSVPGSPSLMLLGTLDTLMSKLADTLGHDDLLWRYQEGIQVIRNKVVAKVRNNLQALLTTPPQEEAPVNSVQIYVDILYASKLLLNKEEDSDRKNIESMIENHKLPKQSFDIIDAEIKQSIEKTRMLYLPLAL